MTLCRQASANQSTCNKRLRAGRWTREQDDNSRRSSTLDLYRPKFVSVLGDENWTDGRWRTNGRRQCRNRPNSSQTISPKKHWPQSRKITPWIHSFYVQQELSCHSVPTFQWHLKTYLLSTSLSPLLDCLMLLKFITIYSTDSHV